jgi:hypothetical protein
VQSKWISNMRPPRIVYPVSGEPAASRLPPSRSCSSRITMSEPANRPSRIRNAAAASDATPLPTR